MQKLFIISFAVIICNCIHAQKTSEVFLNHVYFVLDSSTFIHLFDSAYLKNIGDTSERKTTTLNDSWSGKYLMGKNSYFEFFAANSSKGTAEGGSGFGFITHQSGDISQIKNNWKKSYNDSIETDTTTVTNRGTPHQYFYSISLLSTDTTISTSTWLMENTPEELKSVGFTDEKMKQPISWQQYYEKRHNTIFIKPFNKITSVEIITNKKEYTYLKTSLLGFGMKDDGNNLYNNEVTIKYSIEDIPSTMLKTVTISLDEDLPKHTLIISDHLSLNVNGQIAQFKFNY